MAIRYSVATVEAAMKVMKEGFSAVADEPGFYVAITVDDKPIVTFQVTAYAKGMTVTIPPTKPRQAS